MKYLIQILIFSFAQFGFTLAFAAPVSIKQAVSNGKICPINSVALSASGEKVEVQTDSTPIEVGLNTLKKIDYASCALALSVNVPAGYAVALAPIRISGSKHIEPNSQAKIVYEIFLAGGQSKKTEVMLKSDGKSHYAFTTSSVAPVWTACGKPSLLRFQLSASLASPSLGQSSQLSVDTLKGMASPEIGLLVKKCK